MLLFFHTGTVMINPAGTEELVKIARPATSAFVQLAPRGTTARSISTSVPPTLASMASALMRSMAIPASAGRDTQARVAR